MELERERERRPSLQTGAFHSPLDQRERVGLMPGWARTRSAEGVCTRVSTIRPCLQITCMGYLSS